MTIETGALLQHLPAIRRYARASLGSQEAGDGVVVAAIDALMNEPGEGAAGASPDLRVDLYRRVTKLILNAAETAPASPGDALAEQLHRLAPSDRQMLLLRELEGLRPAVIAEVVGLSADEVENRLARARDELKKSARTDILIIEDEYVIALDIAELVRTCGHRVVGIATNHTDAVALAKTKNPGLILADVNLGAGGSGREAVREILRHAQIPVIFVTAYPEKLFTGDGLEPAYVIPKPFDPMTLAITTYQAISEAPPTA